MKTSSSTAKKFHIYNSLFLALPFDNIQDIGESIPILGRYCSDGYSENKSPDEIINIFFAKYYNNIDEKEKTSILFSFIKYIERQIVLFDSIEDSAFTENNDLDGVGSIKYLSLEAENLEVLDLLKHKLNDFKVRVVLTAHPTQFYPDAVLGIINDLSDAIAENNLSDIEILLQQLGKTKFVKKQKPTPYEEAESLIWYLESVFYNTIGNIANRVDKYIFDGNGIPDNSFIELGFWPGGDRDGNPFVDAKTTLKVADKLRNTILKLYLKDVKDLKKRLTFDIVDHEIDQLQDILFYNSYNNENNPNISSNQLVDRLETIKDVLINRHNGLYIDKVQELINKVRIFGFYFASLDVRQDSSIHDIVMDNIVEYYTKNSRNKVIPANYNELNDTEKVEILSKVNDRINPLFFDNKIAKDTLESIYAINNIQDKNGEKGANRYIISNTQSVVHIMEVFAMFGLCGWKSEELTVDIVPLFETIDDLANAPEIMHQIFSIPEYRNHVKLRNNKQTIMLGFSDGTKDGGYLMANWSIFKAKENLTTIARSYNIDVVFFDGRGGPPARGGGQTHKFYSSLGDNIENKEIQVTIQGQTISSNYGNSDSAQYNLEQLLSAGLSNEIFDRNDNELSDEDRNAIENIAQYGYNKYVNFKSNDKFIPYLEKISTLKYYGKTNIGSRPSKRSKSTEFKFEDLRAIPFVGSWSMLKQNVPGYFGVGTALAEYDKNGKLNEFKELYNKSMFFKALINNSMVSLTKSFFPLTKYLQDNEEFGEFWNLIYNEYKLSVDMIKEISGTNKLMEFMPRRLDSIKQREKVVLPLLTIQQYALIKLEELNKNPEENKEFIESYEMMVIRSLYGNINASRNSV